MKSRPIPWRQRHPKLYGWAIGYAATLLLVGIIAGVFCMIIGIIKSSDAYVSAVARAKTSPVLIAALGVPLQEGWWVTGNIHFSGPTGLAELAIPMSGSKAQGTLYVEAAKHLDLWQLDLLPSQPAPK